MTRLRVKLLQRYAYGFLEGGAVARLSLVADPEGRVIRSGWTSEAPLDISGGSGEAGRFTTFDLPSGGYYALDVARPRGSLITEEYLVREGEDLEETLLIESSPHEYLGWQQYAGVLNQPLGEGRTEASLTRAGGLSETRAFDSVAAPPRLFTATVPRSLEAWLSLAPRAQEVNRRWLKDSLLDWYPLTDPRFLTWFRPRPSEPEAIALAQNLSRQVTDDTPDPPIFPRWITLETGRILHLASVPWAWWGDDEYRGEQVQLLYDRLCANPSDPQSLGRLRVTVQDSRWFGLLEFLASGKLQQAERVADAVVQDDGPKEALERKISKPLTAVAGAIILVARASTSEPQPWDRWLENLCNWFPRIPDGPVILATRTLELAAGRADIERAGMLLEAAVHRGIPYFSASIRMLSLALAQVSEELPHMETLRRVVDGVATRVDPDQPFTVIRL